MGLKICDLNLKQDLQVLRNDLVNLKSQQKVLNDIKFKLNGINAKNIPKPIKFKSPDIEIPNILPIKINGRDIKDIDFINVQSNKFIDLYTDTKQILGGEVMSHYDHTIVDEMNVFGSLQKEGVLVIKNHTEQLNKLFRFLKKQGLTTYAASDLEHKLSIGVYKSIKRRVEGGDLNRKVTTDFKFGYKESELENIAEKDLETFKKKNKGYINYFKEELQQEIDSLSITNFDDEGLNKILDDLRLGSIEQSLKLMDKAQSIIGNTDIGYFLYDKHRDTFFKDLVNAFVGDPQFVFKYRVYKKGPSDSSSLIKYNIQKWKENTGRNPNKKEFETIRNDSLRVYGTFLDRENSSGAFRRLFKNIMSLHYTLKYDKFSMGYGHLSMGMQLASNFLEMQSIFRGLKQEDLVKIQSLQRMIGGLGESTITAGTGQGFIRDKVQDTFVAKTASKIGDTVLKKPTVALLRKLGIKDESMIDRIGNMIEISIGSPMMLDSLNDVAREYAAIYKIINKFGDDVFSADPNMMRSFVRAEYAKIGGAVISTSPIYRETRFTMLNPDRGGYVYLAGIMDSLRYLKGWAIGKSLDLGQQFIQLGKAGQLYFRGGPGDRELAEVYFKDFMGFALHTTQAILNSAVMYGRYEKTNQDSQDKRIDDEKFIVGMTNQLVALDIIMGQEIGNIKGFAGDELTPSEQGVKSIYEFISKVTNYMKVAGFPMAVRQYLELRPGEWGEALEYARNKILGGVFRFGQTVDDKMLNEGIYSNDPLSLFMVEPLTREQISANESFELRDNLSYIEGKKENLFFAIIDLFKGYGIPTDFYFKDKASKKYIDTILKDKGLEGLMNKSATEFDIDSLYEKNPLIISELYKNIRYKGQAFSGVNKDLSKTLTDQDRLDKTTYSFDIMDKYMSDLLREEGMTYEQVSNFSEKNNITDALSKVYLAAQTSGPEKIKYIVPYLIEKDFRALTKGKSGLSNDERNFLKKEAIKNRLELFDVNNESRQLLVRAYIKSKPEVYGDTNKFVVGKIEKLVNSHIDNILLQTRNLKESGTNVKYLTSRYRTNIANIIPQTKQGKQIYANYVIKSLAEAEMASLPEKEKASRQAALLLGMTKEGSDILKDNKVFEELSLPAKKQLANWYYHVTDKLDQYSKETTGDILYNRNKSKGGSRYKKYNRPNFYKSKSPYGSGQRPGFSKQMPTRIPQPLMKYINGDPRPIVRASIKANRLPNRRLIFNLPKKIAALNLRVQFNSIISSNFFKKLQFEAGRPIRKVLKNNRRKIKIAPDRNRKLKKNLPGKVSLNPNGASFVDLLR